MKPDICTSFICSGSSKGYCKECSHAIWYGEGKDSNEKNWRWEFSPQFGPLFLRKDKEPLKNQPIKENHPSWKPFYKWLNNWGK